MMFSYKNGNVEVNIQHDGTKTRVYSGTAYPIFPETVDLKITNQCSLEKYCKWCHESSTVSGDHCDPSDIFSYFDPVDINMEVAIGGGNPLQHPDILTILEYFKRRKLISNITINSAHIDKYFDLIQHIVNEKLVYGVGISYTGLHEDSIKKVVSLTDNAVIHVIAGLNSVRVLKTALGLHNKVLILGYKMMKGRGKDYYNESIERNIKYWLACLPVFFKDDVVISFDNLAIDQLKVRRFFEEEDFNTIYMGEEGKFSMYIDMVRKQYAVSSTSEKSSPINEFKLDFSIVKG